jgi:uncharacterized protein (TIGR02300 family)
MVAAFDMRRMLWQSAAPRPEPLPRRDPREHPMAKPELGLKRVCVACGAKFYDLMKSPAVCPKCGTEQPAEQPRLRRAAAAAEDKIKKRAGVPVEAEADEVELEDVEADAALEHADELEDEDEAIGEEIEVEGDRDEEG